MPTHEETELIRKAVRETIEYTLQHTGMDVSDPHEAQQDMAYLRQLRKGSQMVKVAALTACIGTAASALAWLLWEGFRTLVQFK